MSSFIKPKKEKKRIVQEKFECKSPVQTIKRNRKNIGVRVNKTDIIIPRQVFKNVNVVERKIETKELDKIEFTFLSDEEILEGSVTEITETIFGGPKSLYDMKMGPVTTKDTCATCEGNWEECPGHFGHIPLAVKIPHPILYKKILDYLKIFCMECKKLVITDKRLKIISINKLKDEQKFPRIIKDVCDNIDCCMHCKTKLPIYTFLDDKYIKEINDKKLPVTYEEISNLFYNIREKDIEKIGLDPKKIHPSHYIINNLLVVPTCVRPPVVMSNESRPQHDDLTYKYIDILKTNKKILETTNENNLYNLTNNLVFHIKTLFNNNKGKARDLQGIRPIKCIKKRLERKTGLIRKHIQGKRSNFCGRTVIGPEANCMVDEIVIPQQFADNLTYPVTVNDFNKEKCQKMLEDGKVIYIFRDGKKIIARYACWTEGSQWREGDFILRDNKHYLIDNFISRYNTLPHNSLNLKENDKILRVNYTDDKKYNTYEQFIMPKRKEFLLKTGDIIERKLQNGDWVVLNRQPTLWKGSMRAKKVVIRPGNTIRFNLASTAAFNADFDKVKTVKNRETEKVETL
jgi:DNA-directed RNA polymerase beta' subunit